MPRVKKSEEPIIEKKTSIKEEIASLKKKKKLTDVEKMRLEYLESPVKVITDKSGMSKPVKKAAKKKSSKKSLVKLENGEYFPTPTTLTKLKSYITSYVKAMGWKKKNYAFPDNPKVHITDLKITADKEKEEVYLDCNMMFQTGKIMCVKKCHRVFTLENHKQIRDVIYYTYKSVREKRLFDGESLVYDRDWMVDHDWGFVY